MDWEALAVDLFVPLVQSHFSTRVSLLPVATIFCIVKIIFLLFTALFLKVEAAVKEKQLNIG